MAITLVGFASDDASASSLSLSLPAHARNDVAIIIWGVDEESVTASISGASGWTQVRTDSLNHSTASSDQSSGIFVKALNSSSESNPSLNFSGGSHSIDAAMYVLRGVDKNNPIDNGIEYSVANNDGSPNQPDIDTLTDNAALLVMRYWPGGLPSSANRPASPAGVIILDANSRQYMNTGHLLDAGAKGYKVIHSWDNQGLDSGADSSLYTIAIRPKTSTNQSNFVGGVEYERVFVGATEIHGIYVGANLTFES